MKIALICDSLLLDRSLEMYLKEYLTSYKLCDFVVATQPVESQKPVFLIGDFEGANLKIPFTRELLLQELETFERQVRGRAMEESKNEDSEIYSGEQEERFIKATNVSSASFDIPKIVEYSHFENASFSNVPTKTSSQLTPRDSVLSAKIEEVLLRYAREIEEIVLKHYGDKKI